MTEFPIKAEAKVEGSVIAEKKDIDIEFDPKVFGKHETKETKLWSWRKMRNEKWIILNDCVNNSIQMRKVKEEETG
jgi:hypothetical protein